MVHLPSGSACRPRLAVVLAVLTMAVAARPAQGRQVLFVSNYNSNTVGEYNAVTGAAINPAFINGQGLRFPSAMALDGSNHLFVVSTSNGGSAPQDVVGQYSALTGATINASFASAGFTFGLVADQNNHLFVPLYFYGIAEYDATTGMTINPRLVPFTSGVTRPAVDRNNHIFIASFGSGTVGKYDATTGAALNAVLISGLANPGQVVIDGGNHLFVTYGDYGVSGGTGNILGEFDATTGATINAALITASTGLGSMAFDNNNHLFITDGSNNAVGEYNATTGALINPAFISGLNNPSDLVFMSPIPEPSSLLLVAAAAVAGLCRRRQARAVRRPID